MDFLKPAIRHPARSIQSAVMGLNYHLGNFKNITWLIGDGRSGTTWVSNLINWDKKYREMFEPFHPFVKGMEDFCIHQYIRPDSKDPVYSNVIGSVFSGKFRHHRIDRDNYKLLYDGLLVKDIFANLFACWVINNLPHVKTILLVRNPFMVALSKHKKQQWMWMTDPKDFLFQDELYKDFLAPHEDFIRGLNMDYIEKQILIWAILHYVPLQQLKSGQVLLLFYENLYINTTHELLRLFKFIQGNEFNTLSDRLLEKVTVPSKVSTGRNRVFNKSAALEEWKNKLTKRQIDNGMKILGNFGLDKIYNGESLPDRIEIEKLFLKA